MKPTLRDFIWDHLSSSDSRSSEILDRNELERTLNDFYCGRQADWETIAFALDLRIAQQIFLNGNGTRTPTRTVAVRPLEADTVGDPFRRSGFQVCRVL
jgi:hypothetical protein